MSIHTLRPAISPGHFLRQGAGLGYRFSPAEHGATIKKYSSFGEEADQEIYPVPVGSLQESEAVVEKAKGYRLPSASQVQGDDVDAQYRLRVEPKNSSPASEWVSQIHRILAKGYRNAFDAK